MPLNEIGETLALTRNTGRRVPEAEALVPLPSLRKLVNAYDSGPIQSRSSCLPCRFLQFLKISIRSSIPSAVDPTAQTIQAVGVVLPSLYNNVYYRKGRGQVGEACA